MNRRGFLGKMAAAATAVVAVEKVSADVPKVVVAEESGLVPTKAEGSTVAYDPFERSIPKGVLTQARVQNMRAFGLDPENPEHVEAYLEEV